MSKTEQEVFQNLSKEARDLFVYVLTLEKDKARLGRPIKESVHPIYNEVKGYFQ